MDLSIFYYTHNLLPKDLLENTVKEAIHHANRNNCQLIITSHYPIMDKYENINFDSTDINFESVLINPNSVPNKNNSKYLITDLQIPSQENIKNYVCNLPSRIGSIMKQIIFSCEVCQTSKCLMMEHDCFYPDNYIESANKELDHVDMAYCLENCLMLCKDGFIMCDHNVCLSSFSFKTKVLDRIFRKKLELHKESRGKFITIEPQIKIDYVYEKLISSDGIKRNVIRPKTKLNQYLPAAPDNFNVTTEWQKRDLKDFTYKNIDESLGKDKCILEIEHGLNTSFMLNMMRNVASKIENRNADLYEKYINPFPVHPYWGDSKKFIKMISGIDT